MKTLWAFTMLGLGIAAICDVPYSGIALVLVFVVGECLIPVPCDLPTQGKEFADASGNIDPDPENPPPDDGGGQVTAT